MTDPKKCPKCQKDIVENWFFCAWCGKTLIEKPPDTSIPKQLLIYLVSFFLAPFGLGWGITYVRSRDNKARVVGWIAIILTLVAIGSTIYALSSVMSYYSTMLDGLPKGISPKSYSLFGQ